MSSKRGRGLSRQEWEALRWRVMERDLHFTHREHLSIMASVGGRATTWNEWTRSGTPCVAPFLDGTEWGKCSGVITLDHVKEHLMMGKKAPDDEMHLVSLCWHHHLDGWATAHRPALRAYLAQYGGEREAPA